MPLQNPRHERFASALAEGKPAYQAYIDAGFAKAGAAQSASRLLKSKRAGIRERIAEILVEREQIAGEGTKRAIERTGIDKEWVIERLRENVERAMQVKPVLDRVGNPTGSYVYNGAVANRGLELLGKELGMFIDRRATMEVDDLENLTKEQLIEELRKLEGDSLSAAEAKKPPRRGSKPKLVV
jgi:phage terminase small subunit